MLRRLSILSVCFLLLALFAQTVEAQRTFHISDPSHMGVNGLVEAEDAFYYDSMDALWKDLNKIYTIVNGQDNLEFILYADQEIGKEYGVSEFFRFDSTDGNNRTVTFSTYNDEDFTIRAADGLDPNYDFLRTETLPWTNMPAISVTLSSHLTIIAGSGDSSSNRNATSIIGGGNFNAAGITYTGGGPVLIDYNYLTIGSPRGTNAYDRHAVVNLYGATFTNNSYNAVSRESVLYIKDPERNNTNAVNLMNTTFLDNDGWAVRIEVNDGTYRAAPVVSISLGSDDVDNPSIFSGNNIWVDNPDYDPNDPDSPAKIISRSHTGIVFGGTNIGTTYPTINANISGAGDLLMYDSFYGEEGAYRLRINKTGTGTLYLDEGLTHEFFGLSPGTLGDGNRSTVWSITGGYVDMGKGTRIEMNQNFDQFSINGGTIFLRGNIDASDAATGTHIKAYTVTLHGDRFTPTFVVEGSVLNELNKNGNPLLTIDASVLTRPDNADLIVFDILGVRGNIYNQVLIHNEGSATFQNAQQTQAVNNWRSYAAYIDGFDAVNTDSSRLYALVSPSGSDLLLNININSKIVTSSRLDGNPGSPMSWNVGHSVHWRYETEAVNGETQESDLHYSPFVPNDAVVFNDLDEENKIFNIGYYNKSGVWVDTDLFISQQAGYLTQLSADNPGDPVTEHVFKQHATTEYGIRISGKYNYTFNGGSINDDFDPLSTYHVEQVNHVGRLTFDGTGTVTLNNNGPNVYHDGTVIGYLGYDQDSLSKGAATEKLDITGHTIMNVNGLGSLGSGKYAGETALVAGVPDGAKDQAYTVQEDGFGLKFVGYGGTINIVNNPNYGALETDTLFDQRIRVVQAENTIVKFMGDHNDKSTWEYRDDVATTGIINMAKRVIPDPDDPDAEGETIHVSVTASDAYWVNHENLKGADIDNNGVTVNTLNSGGTIFVDPNTYFEMTGYFDFIENKLLRTYEGNTIRSLNVENFDGGVLWVGYGASVNMTDASFIGNGYFYDRDLTQSDPEDQYKRNGQVRYGGAIYFTGGINAFTGEIATLTLSASSSAEKTNVAQNIANVGGAIYVAQGAGAVINVENVVFTGNIAVLADSSAGGGAMFIRNDSVDGELKNVVLNAAGSEYHNNIAYGSPGGAIRLFQGNTVDLSGSTFSFNGVVKDVDAEGNEIDAIRTVVTTYGGALYVEDGSRLSIEASQFTSNAATGDGGAIYAKGTVLNGNRAIFTNNQAGRHGGAIYVDDFMNAPLLPGERHVSLGNSTFRGNSALGDGGALYFKPGYFTLNVDSSTFESNKAGDANTLGGAIYAGGEEVTISGINAIFAENTAALKGGAVYLGDFGTLFMNGAEFRSNKVTGTQGQGGAVYTGVAATLDFTGTGTNFRENVAAQEGGAIYTANDENNRGTLTFNGAAFVSNISSSASGGAVYARNMVVRGDEARFSMNVAATDGGALHLISTHKEIHETKTVELNNSAFSSNKATTGRGGAIFLDFDYAVLNAESATFLANTAFGHGGAIYATAYSTLNVGGSTFGDAANGNQSLSNSGGAIYLNGGVVVDGTLTTTSQLNAEGATFAGNVAAIDGGAVYLLYADADISGAAFKENKAEAGRGGGLFYENESGKDLIVETADFTKNIATMGGAVYTVNETFIHAKDTALSENQATDGDGGAIYFESTNSQLDISKTTASDTRIKIEGNSASGDGGAIRMQLDSRLIANNTAFSSNWAGGSGGAFRIDGDVSLGLIADVQASGASFNNNTADGGDGGAVYLNDESTPNFGATLNRLLLNGSLFQKNLAGNSGGAIHASNTDLNVASSIFEENEAGGDGGAIYLLNSDLNAWGSSFMRNSAGTDGKGGAIYFLTTNNDDRTVYLGAGNGQTVGIDGNKMGQDVPNSIYFETGHDFTSFVSLEVATEGNGILSMRDPMAVDYSPTGRSGNLIDLDIVKTGTGTWELGGNNDFSITQVGTTVDIKEGTFALLPGATLKLTNVFELQNSGTADYFVLERGAAFKVGGNSSDSGPARLETTNLDFAVGTTMQLDSDFVLNVESDYSIGSILSGWGSFTKEDGNVLTFLGATKNFNGNVSITHGEFRVFKSNEVEGSGRFETTYGVFYMGPGTDLYLIADPDRPALTAKSAIIDLVNLHVSGISGTYENEIILIHTTDGIIGDFSGIGADGDMTGDVDYLSFNLGFLNDRKDYGGTIGLRWYSTANNIPAWGKFTLTDENDYFNVAVELVDNNTNLYTADPTKPGYDPNWPYAWNGTTLDKLGLGTLELSARNRYTGATTVHAGEVYLTDPSGTGVGDAKVQVKDGARLGLNFTGLYEKTVWGDGQVIVRGGVVELGADNEYAGGTVLKNGILEFTKSENLGTGTITFEGGTLRNKAEAFLNQEIAIGLGSTANFDVPLYDADSSVPSLTVDGVIYGNGGLEKTGKGILALNADNTFTGTSYIREGGLKIDGAVAGDVRVSQYASVGGKGRIGGDLFLRSGAYYDWFFTTDRGESAPLHVVGNVNLADGAIFRPRTDDTDFAETIIGWTVLRYEGALGGEFTTIDDTFNAFYSFELDYSTPGEVRVAGELLTRPKALGDIVATSLCIANKKLYRNSFGQLARETAYHKTPQQHGVRGQTFQPTRSIWFTPMARANVFGTNYVGGNYDFESYGSQVGSTLWSDNRSTLGLMFGYERGNLRNRLDQIRSHEYYLGLYYGYLFGDGREIRAFVGGGFQKYTMFRYDATENYSTSYDGSSFEMNLEYGKFFAGQNGTLLRPYIAADVEHSSVSSAQEGAVGNAYRHYGKADLSQLFFRLGVDLEKRWQYVDWNGGLSYSCLILGKRRAEADIFYPVRGAGTTSYSARLGRSSMTLQTGLNWHLDRIRSNTFFLDYFADIYMDRTGDGVQHTAAVGYRVRF